MKKNINNYCNNISNNIHFKISTLIMNSKLNKSFGTLLKLCIKYDIQLFNNDNDNNYNIRQNKDIINDVIYLKKKMIINYTNNILNIQNNDNFLIDMDNLYNDIRKNIKELQTLYILLNDIYNDIELKKMFYNNENNDKKSDENNDKKSDENNDKKKYKIVDKFIAEYIC